MERLIGFEIRALTNLFKREICKNTEIRLDSNTELHGMIIGYLFDNQGKDTFQKDFEEEFSMRRSTISRMLKLMEKNGMISRLPVGQDARLKKIVLTTKAIEVQDSMKEFRTKLESRMKQGISNEELDVFFTVIDKIKKNLE